MTIGATVGRHSTDAEFDIDVMAQINGYRQAVSCDCSKRSVRGRLGSFSPERRLA